MELMDALLKLIIETNKIINFLLLLLLTFKSNVYKSDFYRNGKIQQYSVAVSNFMYLHCSALLTTFGYLFVLLKHACFVLFNYYTHILRLHYDNLCIFINYILNKLYIYCACFNKMRFCLSLSRLYT